MEALSRRILGWPYLAGGRDERGIDCLGVLMLAWSELGARLPEFEYDGEWYRRGGDHFADNWADHAVRVDRADRRGGDAVLLTMFRDVACHVGVLVGRDTLLHARRGSGVVLEPLRGYAGRTEGFYRPK